MRSGTEPAGHVIHQEYHRWNKAGGHECVLGEQQVNTWVGCHLCSVYRCIVGYSVTGWYGYGRSVRDRCPTTCGL